MRGSFMSPCVVCISLAALNGTVVDRASIVAVSSSKGQMSSMADLYKTKCAKKDIRLLSIRYQFICDTRWTEV